MSLKHFFCKFLKKKNNTHSKVEIIIGEKTLNGKVEGYNRLRDNVLYLNTDGSKKVIQIGSAVAHEGKTTIACNLAVSLGLADKKVCVVDLDFRRPKVNRAFKMSNENGIADYILGNLNKEEVIKHTECKNVDIITRGAKIYNSTIVLLSDKFKELIKTLRDEYDYVILDCAPILLVSDHIHISQVSDGVLFVVAYASTTKTQVADAIQTLRSNNAKILGTVFSLYDKKKDRGYGHYYGKNYYYKTGYYNYYNTIKDSVDEEETVDSVK